MISIDVVMLSCTKDAKSKKMTQEAINTLEKSESNFKFTINLVETNGLLYNQFGPYGGNVNHIFPNEEFGYNKFLNIGFKNITSDYVVIANNDLVFNSGWFSKIYEAVCVHGLDSACPKSPGWEFHKNYGDDVYMAWGTGHEWCGWCIVIRREALEKLLPFPEDLLFWCQDDFMAFHMQTLGMKHALVGSSHVRHLVNQSHRFIPKEKMHEYTHGQVTNLAKNAEELKRKHGK